MTDDDNSGGDSLRRLTADEVTFVNDLGAAGAALWEVSTHVVGLTDDPRITSVKLYRRLWSNHRGFVLLWRAGLQLEADIVLRSALEAAICIAANHALQAEFAALLRGDLVATIKSQIKRWRDDGDAELVRDAEAELRRQLAGAPARPHAFDWKELAEVGGQPTLYGFHKGLSMMSSHVTGFSLMHGVVGADGDGAGDQEQLLAMRRKVHLMMLAGPRRWASSSTGP